MRTRKIESCFLKPERWLLICYSEGSQIDHEERKASAAEEFLCNEIGKAHERADRLDRALRSLIAYWREMGPEGFDELIESKALTAQPPNSEAVKKAFDGRDGKIDA